VTSESNAGKDTPNRTAHFAVAGERFRQAFFLHMKGHTLPEFGRFCQDRLNHAGPYDLPYAFAYAARSVLHDPQSWSRTDSGLMPTCELLDTLDTLLARSDAIDCRDNYYYPVVEGVRSYIAGHHREAYRQLAATGRLADFHRIVKDDCGGASVMRTFPTPGQLEAVRGRLAWPMEFFRAPRSMCQVAYSVSFDALYAEAFAPVWIEKFRTFGDHSVGLHLHIVFRGAPQMALMDGLWSLAPVLRDRLWISCEHHVSFDRAYFASTRFMHGAALLKTLGCPIFFVDADATIEHDAPAIQALSANEDRIRGLSFEGPEFGYLPWRAFGATWLFVPCHQTGADFLDVTARCIEHFWDDRTHRNWWIDQAALRTAHLILGEQGLRHRFHPIGDGLPTLFHSSEAYKLRTLGAVPRVATLVASGKTIFEATRMLGQEEALNAET
jgi:hypothetical protein